MKSFISLYASLSALLVSLFGASQAWSPPPSNPPPSLVNDGRRSFVSSLLVSGTLLVQSRIANAESADDESFASIAARASKIQKDLVQEEAESSFTTNISTNIGDKTAYDFSLPMAGNQVPIRELVRASPENNKVKAILFVNIKQDDIVARKNIPELIALAAKYVQHYIYYVYILIECHVCRSNQSYFFLFIHSPS